MAKNVEEIIDIARAEPDRWVQGAKMGEFVAKLNYNKPLSDDPQSDAKRAAAEVALLRIRLDETVERESEISALLEGGIVGVEDYFHRIEQGATA